jgi:hypothetical protein
VQVALKKKKKRRTPRRPASRSPRRNLLKSPVRAGEAVLKNSAGCTKGNKKKEARMGKANSLPQG